jgi:Uma2 family endonuclease
MTMILQKTRYTPEDLLNMADGDLYELVDGSLVERPMSFWSSYVAGVLFGLLHDQANRLGWLLGEGTTYQCFPHKPEQLRRSDLSFIRLDRMSLAEASKPGHVKIAPDLAVEVISPNDGAYDVDEKVQDYLQARVRLIWVIHPLLRTVCIYRLDGTVSQLGEQDELSGEDVVPGFRCQVADMFVPPAGVAG